jgi:hypothetical protein
MWNSIRQEAKRVERGEVKVSNGAYQLIKRDRSTEFDRLWAKAAFFTIGVIAMTSVNPDDSPKRWVSVALLLAVVAKYDWNSYHNWKSRKEIISNPNGVFQWDGVERRHSVRHDAPD